MKTISKIFLGVALLFALPACKDKMQELNTNPDIAHESDPRYLFLRAIQNYKNDSHWSNNGKLGSMDQVQYLKNRQTDADDMNDPATATPRQGIGMDSFYGHYYTDNQRWGLYLRDIVKTIDNWGDPNHPTYDEVKHKRWIEVRSISMICWMDLTIELFFVQGAGVFTQAFQAFDGITFPEYDLAQDVIEIIDGNLQEAVAVLAGAMNSYADTRLADYDRVFGWKPDVSKATKMTDYPTIRTRWAKYGNAMRLRMAFMLQHVQPDRFKTVVNQIGASGLMSGNEDSAFYNHGFADMTGSESAHTYRNFTTTALVSNLKRTNDPRLPLLARVNDLYTTEKGFSHPYWYMKSFYPDSLQYRKINGVNVPWGTMLEEGNYFEGLSANPLQIRAVQPGERITTPDITFYLKNPNGASGPYYATSAIDGQTYPVMFKADTTITIRVASPAQNRYRVVSGGNRNGFGGAGGTDGDYNGDDGTPSSNESEWSNIGKRESLFTYPELCFMMSYMDGGAGKSATQWYNDGVKAAFQQLDMDAERYRIVIATDATHPKLPGLNPGGLYRLTDAMFDTYIAANPYNGQESVAYQAWVYLYAHTPQSFNVWYRLTQYPATWDKNVLTYADRTGPATWRPWLEKRMRDASAEHAFPRRGGIPLSNALNKDNHDAIMQKMYSQPGYGNHPDTWTGRLWYDTKDPIKFQ